MKYLTEDDFIESGDLTKSDHWKIDKKIVEQIIVNQEDSILCQQLIKILVNHCGETGENEGAVETLNRIIEDADKWNKDHDYCKTNLEIVERLKEELKDLREQKELTGYDIMHRDWLIAILGDKHSQNWAKNSIAYEGKENA
jgi:hypothetical protein